MVWLNPLCTCRYLSWVEFLLWESLICQGVHVYSKGLSDQTDHIVYTAGIWFIPLWVVWLDIEAESWDPAVGNINQAPVLYDMVVYCTSNELTTECTYWQLYHKLYESLVSLVQDSSEEQMDKLLLKKAELQKSETTR